jgi:hypothetical protein
MGFIGFIGDMALTEGRFLTIPDLVSAYYH